MRKKRITTIKDAQKFLRYFSRRNNWQDFPNIDKFDHLHEELIEMSQHIRYKNIKERQEFIKNNKELFVDGIGDLFFGLCRLANQLNVDVEEAFNIVKDEIINRYNCNSSEKKPHTPINL